MNVTINVDCTPEEARRLMGLPDLTPLHDLYLDKMRTTMDSGITPEMVSAAVRNWSGMGEAGVAMWRQVLDQVAKTSAGGGGR